MNRTQTKQIHVGSVAIGGGAPVAVQSMCNTHTSDARATIEQIARLHDAGCEIIRLAVPDQAAAKGFAAIAEVQCNGCGQCAAVCKFEAITCREETA